MDVGRLSRIYSLGLLHDDLHYAVGNFVHPGQQESCLGPLRLYPKVLLHWVLYADA